MLKKYCLNATCAQPNYYTLETPKFCSFCGASLDGSNLNVASQSPKKHQKPINNKKTKASQPVDDEDDTEDDETEYDIPDINNLQVEIIGTRQKLTLGELGQQKKTGITFNQNVPKITQEEAIKQFRQEAQGKSIPIELGDSEE